MEITHKMLLEIGFLPVTRRLHTYHYKGFRGVLVGEIGLFSFDGLTREITLMSDLRFLIMLIDSPATEQAWPYTTSNN